MSVSVVIPAYNAARYLGEAIESVLRQTHEAFELIVIDDGSKDATAEVALRYAESDPRVAVRSRPNRGVAPTLDEGLHAARHPLVAIMHADDVMLPTRLERQVAFLDEHPEVAAASSFVHYIGPDGRRLGTYRSVLTDPAVVRAKFDAGQVVAMHHPAAMLRREAALAVGGYREGFTVTEDIDLWVRLLEAGHGVLVQPEYLLEYRMHGTSASVSQALKMARETRWVMACSAARRAGRREPTFAEHLATEAAAPATTRWRRAAEDRGQVHYKAAVFAYANRDLPGVLRHLALSTVWRPGYGLRQAWRKRRGASDDA